MPWFAAPVTDRMKPKKMLLTFLCLLRWYVFIASGIFVMLCVLIVICAESTYCLKMFLMVGSFSFPTASREETIVFLPLAARKPKLNVHYRLAALTI